MKLGVIGAVNEESFQDAGKRGLDFIEFCINGGYPTEEFFDLVPKIKEWQKKYNVCVGSIGRWKAFVLDDNGAVDADELELAFKLIDAAGELGCSNYVCGCNYIEALSYYENITRAIEFFSKLVEHGKSGHIDISTYNCRKMNFVCEPAVWKLVHGHIKELGIKYDPSHAVYNGGDYLKETKEWGHRFYHVHLKGSLCIDGERIDDPPAGLDQTDWKSFLSILYAKQYSRGLSIEPHSPNWQGELGQKGLDYTIRYMKDLLFR